jgi:hypothetical protein
MSENSIREALEGAFEQEPVDNTPDPVQNDPVASEPAPVSEPPAGETGETKTARDYVRDELGKFAPKDEKNAPLEPKTAPEEPKPAAEGIKAGPKVGQPPVAEEKPAKDPIAQAPSSWKPEARELWSQIPEAAKHEIARWEATVKNGLKQAAEVRRFGDAIGEAIAPYRATIEAEGSNPVQAVGHLLQTAQALRTAPPAHKAQLVAGMIKQFGIDVQALDRALVGMQPEPVDPQLSAVKQQLEQEFAPLKQMQQQLMQQQQMFEVQQQQEARGKVDEFLANPPEFLDDVHNDMVNIINLGVQRGVEYTLQQAYDIACRAHPEVNKVLAQREQAKVAQNLSQNAQKARQAAVSLGGAPSLGGQDAAPDSVRDAILLAMNQGAR